MASWRWPARQPPLLPAVRGWPPLFQWQALPRRPDPSQCLPGSGGRRVTGAGPSVAVLADVVADGAGVAAGGRTENLRTVVKIQSYFSYYIINNLTILYIKRCQCTKKLKSKS